MKNLTLKHKNNEACRIVAMIFTAALMIFSLNSCGKDDSDVAVSSVSIAPTTLTIVEGETGTVKATIMPEKATNKNIAWKSDKTDIATVDNNGKVTAVKAGSATITATTEDGTKTVTCAVTVKAATVAVTGVELDKTTLEIGKGENATLTAAILPENATDKSVKWTTDNKSVATVDQNGKVEAVAIGEAIITVTTDDGNKAATCNVTVTANVYVGGYVENASGKWVATLWTNGTAQSLSNGTTSAEVYSIYVSGDDVYAGGHVTNASGRRVATLWTNGMAQSLSNGTTSAEVYSIYVSGNDVYVGGYVQNASGKYVATIWKNGTAQSLSNGTTSAEVYSIYVSGDDVYAGGYVLNASRNEVATIWKNGKAQSISNETTYADVYSIYVLDGDVYAGGHATNASGKEIATIWKNGAAQSLTNGTTYSYVSSIFVVK